MRLVFALLVLFSVLSIGACQKEKTTDLAQEMAAQKEIMEIKLLIKEGNDELADKKLVKLEERFGHTKTYIEAKQSLLNAGLTTDSPEIALTGKKLFELENLVLDYRKETGEWPAPGMIAKPLDAWDNELYWIVATPDKSYDLLIISSGKDGDPGTEDELIVVWVAPKLEKKKSSKADPKGKGGGSDSKKKLEESEMVVMTLDDLLKMEEKPGAPADRDMTLKQFKTAGNKSKKAGQPRRGETIMTLEEIKTKL